MLSRRELIAAGVAGGLVAPDAPSSASVEEQQADRAGQREIASRIGGLEDALRSAYLSPTLGFGVIARLRAEMETFLRANGKFPDFVEVGTGVFYDVYDWHVKHRQQILVTRLADGRYTMQFMFTSLLLRPEQERNHVGVPFDRG